MKKNFMLIVALAAMLFFAAPMTTEAAEGEGSWKQNATGWWYEYSDGSYLTDGMFEIDCINCGTPVAVEWNRKKKGYVTIGE